MSENSDYLEICNIGKPARNGALEPRLCIAEDGKYYYVKSELNAGLVDLRYEYICAALAKELELPIPAFKIVLLSQEIVDASAFYDEGIKERIKPESYGFASHKIDESLPINDKFILDLPDGLKARVLLFDLWINNNDRKEPSIEKANPNFLYVPTTSKPYLIDHNNAFAFNFEDETFFKHHVFSEAQKLWDRDFIDKECEKFERAISKIGDIVANLPQEWKFGNQELLCYNTIEQLVGFLSRFKELKLSWIRS